MIKSYNNLKDLTIINETQQSLDYTVLANSKDVEILTLKLYNSSNEKDEISKMTQLKYLSYGYYGDIDKFNSIDFLKDCNELEFVYLSVGIDSDKPDSYSALYSMPNLKVIAFSGMCDSITKEQAEDIRKNMPDCMISFIK